MNLDHMWERLAQHQPYADKHGYGKAWARMCGQRTRKAARAAQAAAWARPAREAAWAVDAARAAVDWIERAEGEE